MTHDPMSPTQKPCLDDLLTKIGITREQLTEMTADDLFAAATRWQDAATIATAEAQRVAFPTDRFLASLQAPPAGLASMN